MFYVLTFIIKIVLFSYVLLYSSLTMYSILYLYTGIVTTCNIPLEIWNVSQILSCNYDNTYIVF